MLASPSEGEERKAVPKPDLDGRSFEEFVTAALPALLRFGHVLTGSPQEAEDLC
jgi:DNA-directed RNA polymerase specialized sigma24 family protein